MYHQKVWLKTWETFITEFSRKDRCYKKEREDRRPWTFREFTYVLHTTVILSTYLGDDYIVKIENGCEYVSTVGKGSLPIVPL